MKLPDAERQLLGYLWALERAYLKDLVEAYPDPRPAKTTVATLLRRLVDKGAVGFRTHGTNREYYPAITKRGYFGRELRDTIETFFGASPTAYASFFTDEARLDEDGLRELRQLIDERLGERDGAGAPEGRGNEHDDHPESPAPR